MATPREKRTLQDYWNIPFRGFVPGGLNDQKDNPALPKITNPPDAEVMIDAEVECDPKLLVTDEVECIRRCFHAFQVQVGDVETVQILGQDTFRHRVMIRNVGPGGIFIGSNESVRDTGYEIPQMAAGIPVILETTEEVWALQETGEATTAVVHIYVEFDKIDKQVKGYNF